MKMRKHLQKLLISRLASKRITPRQFRAAMKKHSKREETSKNYNLYGTIKAHNGPVERVVPNHSFNKTFIISGGMDGLIKIFDIDKQLLIVTLYGHTCHVIDICIHSSGKYIASADVNGTVLVHEYYKYNEKDCFKLINKFDLGDEILFCEFVKGFAYSETTSIDLVAKVDSRYETKEKPHEMIALTAGGNLVYLDIFKDEEIYRNTALTGHGIKAICITDGGRYLFCGGRWPYLALYDVYDPESMILLEDFRIENNSILYIENIAAAKNVFKVATSHNSIVSIYQYLNKKIRKYTIEATEFNNTNQMYVFRISFLANGLLVILGSDKIVRIYEDDMLLCLADGIGLGSIYTHPSEDIFVIETENDLTFYQVINHRQRYKIVKIHTIRLTISVNDCVFSNNGQYFIASDDTGAITSYKLNFTGRSTNTVQFFRQDLLCNSNNSAVVHELVRKRMKNEDVRDEVYEIMKMDGIGELEYDGNIDVMINRLIYSETVDTNRKNSWWYSTAYEETQKEINMAWITENRAAKHMSAYKIKFERSDQSEKDISSETSEFKETSVQEVLKQTTIGGRNFIESSSCEEIPSKPVLRRDARRILENDVIGGMNHRVMTRRQLIEEDALANLKNFGDLEQMEQNAEESAKRILIDENRKEAVETADIYKKKEKDTLASLIDKAPFKKSRKLIEKVRSTSNTEETEIQAEKLERVEHIERWFDNLQFNKKDEIYLDNKRLKQFALDEKRIKTKTDIKTGYYTIEEIEVAKLYYQNEESAPGEDVPHIKYIKLTLHKNGKTFKNISFYENGLYGIACLKRQHENYKEYEIVTIAGTEIRGMIDRIDGCRIQVCDEWFTQSEIYCGNKNLDLSKYLVEKEVEFNTPFYYINYERINTRIRNGLYRNKDDLVRDINQLFYKSKELESSFYDDIKANRDKILDE
ncbi:hypothetical protein ECANGB1_1976 [Enterospora canceri]|uniref:Uncharacterized protein n=1 Tax=Enterospora canceri TaxID=1081671 RepID=A0A1Y1S5W8_9MICR|nr:hypothetical protein ECANGB1_1976 [Enterospora canceri]